MNIYWESTGYNYNVSLNGCTITGNKANTGGGGIATYNPNSSQLLGLSVINSVISGNTVNTTSTHYLIKIDINALLASCQGGGIYFYQGAFLKVVGSTISDNHAIKRKNLVMTKTNSISIYIWRFYSRRRNLYRFYSKYWNT